MSRKLPTGIDKLASGLYRARVPVKKPDGTWRNLSKSFSRQKDAVAWRESVIVAKQTGRIDTLDADLITLRELAAEHMTAAHAALATRTYAVYHSLWSAHVQPHAISSMTLRAITPKVIEDWRDEVIAGGAGSQSIRKLMTLMQTVFKRAVRDERIKRNPVELVSKPKVSKPEGIVPTTPVKVERIRAQLSGADAAMVSVLAYVGMRPSEARALKWADLGERVVHIWRAADATGVKATKTENHRHPPLCDAVKADLAAWRRESGDPPDAAFIFPRKDGEPWTDHDWRNWRSRRFRAAVTKAGVTLARPYDLRHSAASLWIAEGRNVVEVAHWLGNDPTMTLGTYAHIVADRDPANPATFDDLITAARRDISVTYGPVMSGPTAVVATGEKPSIEGGLAEVA